MAKFNILDCSYFFERSKKYHEQAKACEQICNYFYCSFKDDKTNIFYVIIFLLFLCLPHKEKESKRKATATDKFVKIYVEFGFMRSPRRLDGWTVVLNFLFTSRLRAAEVPQLTNSPGF